MGPSISYLSAVCRRCVPALLVVFFLEGILVAVACAKPQPAARTDGEAPVAGVLVIMTSFPASVFGKYKEAFEREHPGVTVFVRNKKTSAAISFIEDRSNEPVDIFWASSPDAFDVLKESGHLQQLDMAGGAGARRIGGYPVDDPDGYYKGFALSGYGVVWNPVYLKRLMLPAPQSWDDLRRQIYRGHIGISAPSRSGTTHLIVESILQQKGWTEGWATLLEIGGNLATVTARSYGVPEGVRAGRFGIGASIDFLGLSLKAMGAPLDFAYVHGAPLLPASIAIVKQSANLAAARAFVAFVLSARGQQMLLDPAVSRLPVMPGIHDAAFAAESRPSAGDLVVHGIDFDTRLSRQRYYLVNLMFDALITFPLSTLKRSWAAVHAAEQALRNRARPDLEAKLAGARALLASAPVSREQAEDQAFTSVFVRPRPGMAAPQQQIEQEKAWAAFARNHHEQALKIAAAVLAELNKGSEGARQ